MWKFFLYVWKENALLFIKYEHFDEEQWDDQQTPFQSLKKDSLQNGTETNTLKRNCKTNTVRHDVGKEETTFLKREWRKVRDCFVVFNLFDSFPQIRVGEIARLVTK